MVVLLQTHDKLSCTVKMATKLSQQQNLIPTPKRNKNNMASPLARAIAAAEAVASAATKRDEAASDKTMSRALSKIKEEVASNISMENKAEALAAAYMANDPPPPQQPDAQPCADERSHFSAEPTPRHANLREQPTTGAAAARSLSERRAAEGLENLIIPSSNSNSGDNGSSKRTDGVGDEEDAARTTGGVAIAGAAPFPAGRGRHHHNAPHQNSPHYPPHHYGGYDGFPPHGYHHQVRRLYCGSHRLLFAKIESLVLMDIYL